MLRFSFAPVDASSQVLASECIGSVSDSIFLECILPGSRGSVSHTWDKELLELCERTRVKMTAETLTAQAGPEHHLSAAYRSGGGTVLHEAFGLRKAPFW